MKLVLSPSSLLLLLALLSCFASRPFYVLGDDPGDDNDNNNNNNNNNNNDDSDDSDDSLSKPACLQLVLKECSCRSKRLIRRCSRRVARERCKLSNPDRSRVIDRAIRKCRPTYDRYYYKYNDYDRYYYKYNDYKYKDKYYDDYDY